MLSLRKSILISACFHLGVFSLFFFLSRPGGAKVIYKPQYQVRLVQPSEIPSLSKTKSKAVLKPKPAVPKKKVETKKVVLPDKSKPKKKEVKRTPKTPEKKPENDDQALDDVLAKLKKKSKTWKETESSAPSGTQATGWEERQKALQYSAYYDEVERRVRENWIPPKALDSQGQDVITVVSITLLPDGRVLKSLIEESSGDPIFDQSVMRAIMKAAPLPVPPIGLKQKNYDLGLRFHSSPHRR